MDHEKDLVRRIKTSSLFRNSSISRLPPPNDLAMRQMCKLLCSSICKYPVFITQVCLQPQSHGNIYKALGIYLQIHLCICLPDTFLTLGFIFCTVASVLMKMRLMFVVIFIPGWSTVSGPLRRFRLKVNHFLVPVCIWDTCLNLSVSSDNPNYNLKKPKTR